MSLNRLRSRGGRGSSRKVDRDAEVSRVPVVVGAVGRLATTRHLVDSSCSVSIRVRMGVGMKASQQRKSHLRPR